MTAALFKPVRVCCCCGAQATNNTRERIPGEPNIIAISMVIYRRGKNKAALKSTRRIQVCEECLTSALTDGRLTWTAKSNQHKLWEAIRASVLDRYSEMCEKDEA